MKRYKHGLLIGKFYPPHLGHHRAIREGTSLCKRFTVLVMASAVETIPLRDRVAWLEQEHEREPTVRVLGIPCDAPLDLGCPEVWTAQVGLMRAALRVAGDFDGVDLVLCGDDYGPELARRLGADNVQIDRNGMSSSAVRSDLAGRWADLADSVRAGLTTRVIVVGAESTGTTTIAGLLASHYSRGPGVWTRTKCVEEYGREYTQLKLDGSRSLGLRELVWSAEDFDAIGIEQTRREQLAARAGSPVLICDTDSFATSIWERRYLGSRRRNPPSWVEQLPPRAVYLVTDHDGVEWHDDGLREGDLGIRADMTNWFMDALTAAGHSWVLLTGGLEQRLKTAIRTVDPLLTLRADFGEPLRGPGFEAAT